MSLINKINNKKKLLNSKNIVISGTIGVGKTTICSTIKDLISDSIFVNEKTVSSHYLKLFYSNPKQWALISQLTFLIERHEDWILSKNNNKVNIFERSLLDDWVFNQSYTNSNFEYTLNSALVYQHVWEKIINLEESNKFIDFFFLLKAPYEVTLDRINYRNRSIENAIDETYSKALYNLYYENKSTLKKFKRHSKFFFIIDSNRELIEIINEIISILKKHKIKLS